MRKLLFNYSFYSHPEIGKFQGVTNLPPKHNIVPRFEERRNKEKGDKQEYYYWGR
jgi:hypothetical protein